MPFRALLALSFVVAGCLPRGPLVQDAPEGTAAGYPDHSVDQIIGSVAASVAPVERIAADGDLTFTSPQESQSATFSLRARLADSVTVVVRGPLGIEGGRALLTADSVFVINKLADQFVLGPLSAADAVVPGASVDGRIARAALGLLVPEREVDWTLVAREGLYQLTGRVPGGEGSRAYTVDPALWRVVRVVEFDADGRQSGEQSVASFDTVDGVVLPREVRLAGAGTTVELTHRRLVVNPEDLRIRFVRPTGYEVIEVE